MWSVVAGHMSLAPYRGCLGPQYSGKGEESTVRGSFDRGDLKEAAGAASPMEPRGAFLGFDAGRRGRLTPRVAGNGTEGATGEGGTCLKGH